MMRSTSGWLAWLALLALILTACNGGLRPTLVDPADVVPEAPLVLDLEPAPGFVTPLAPPTADLALESSVDDALISWSIDRSVPYLDSCDRVEPGPGEYCDVATERDTVRLLGPSADEIWYVVTVAETDSLQLGTGYRVETVAIAGR